MQANTIIQLRADEGVRTALVVTVGPKWATLLWADSAGMKLRKLKVGAVRYTELDYPLARAKRHFRRMCRNFGATKSAKRALRG